MKMNVKRILAALAVALAVPALPAWSQGDSAEVYTIEQCYDLVRQNYPLVKRYELLDLTEEYTLKNAYMNYFPQISLQGSASWQTDVLEFPFDLSPYGVEMPTFSKDQYAAVLELSQVLWDGGMIAANRANIRAKADVDMAQQEINMYSLREKVNELYFGILYLDQQICQVDIMMEELGREYARIEGCIANGVASLSDLDLIEVERIAQNQSRDQLSSMLDAYLRVLTMMTGVRIDDSRQLVMPLPGGMDKEAMLDALIVSEIRRPELDLYKAQELEIDTQLDYWTAGGLPQFSLFIRGGYGRPGLNMLDNSFQPFAIGGIRLVWNISQLYSLGYGKKIVNYSKEQVNTVRETFLFNTNLQVQEQVAEIRRYFKTVEDDERIVELSGTQGENPRVHRRRSGERHQERLRPGLRDKQGECGPQTAHHAPDRDDEGSVRAQDDKEQLMKRK